MDEIRALHTAARRYCLMRYRFWSEEYTALQKGREHRMPYTYTNKDLDTFPRYNVMDAIRIEIERCVPEDFETERAMRKRLATIGASAHSMFTRNPQGDIDEAAMDDERERFVAYLASLTPDQLSFVDPLPYHRTLGDQEAAALLERLSKAWHIDGHWYPLSATARHDVEAFQDRHFLKEGCPKKLRKALANRNVTRVFELREWEPHTEIAIENFTPAYDGRDGFWFDDTMEWLVYASPDASISVAGWLLPELQDRWPGWAKRVWRSPFFK